MRRSASAAPLVTYRIDRDLGSDPGGAHLYGQHFQFAHQRVGGVRLAHAPSRPGLLA